jgi:cytochrome P450
VKYVPDWFPGTGFKAEARKMAASLNRTVDQPYAFVKQQMSVEKHKVSYVSQAIEDTVDNPKLEQILKWTAFSMFASGADTTVTALMIFFLAMTVFPEVQKKAQEELDRVIGGKRLPNSADKGSLPYIEAVMKEAHRWHTVVPMSLPHVNKEEDSIHGYRIPKGSIVMPNNW